MNFFNTLRGLTKSSQSKENFDKFAFQYKVAVRKNFKGKNVLYGSLVNIDRDIKVEHTYQGPRLESSSDLTPQLANDIRVWFAKENLLHRKYVYQILILAEKLFRKTPILVDVKLPETSKLHVCGDIHGQYYDLLKIFREKGTPTETNMYLFNGDIVDKGCKSVECILLLIVMKLVYPNFVFLNRGNHESALINLRNGFAKEIRKKYDDFFIFDFFGEIFRWMPIVHLVEDRVFVVHGGLSAKCDFTLQDIRILRRPVEPHENELAADLLWSDPKIEGGSSLSPRGIGVFFGPDITKAFLERNDLYYIVRSHSEVSEGCGLSHEGCYTVYSAPSFRKGIIGGILTIHGKRLNKQGHIFYECIGEELEKFKSGLGMESKDAENSSKETDLATQVTSQMNLQ